VMSDLIGLSGQGLPACCTGHMGPSRTLPWIPAAPPEAPIVDVSAHAESEKTSPIIKIANRFMTAG